MRGLNSFRKRDKDKALLLLETAKKEVLDAKKKAAHLLSEISNPHPIAGPSQNAWNTSRLLRTISLEWSSKRE